MWIMKPWKMIWSNTVVSNYFHSVKILLFSSARSRDFDGLIDIELRCQCTQQKLQSICAVLTFDPQLKKILTFSVRQISIKLFYLYQRLQCRDNYFLKIKFVFFLYLLLSASWKENVKTRKRRNVVGIDMSDSKQPYCNMFLFLFFPGRLVYLSRLLIDILHCQLNQTTVL